MRSDPEYKGGDYTVQPRSLQFASVFYGIATNGGNQALVRAASDRARADALCNARMVWVKGGPDTAGHGTTANAKWWKAEFDAWFRGVPKRTD